MLNALARHAQRHTPVLPARSLPSSPVPTLAHILRSELLSAIPTGCTRV